MSKSRDECRLVDRYENRSSLTNETPGVNEDLVSRQNQPVFAGYRKAAGRLPRAVLINVLRIAL